MELTTKYSSKDYKFLCFRHATQEAMRGENVFVEIVDVNNSAHIYGCSLCNAEDTKSEAVLRDWYHNFRFDK